MIFPKKKLKAFTLIELLIVIAIIAILASAIVITVNPLDRLASARDTTRKLHLNSIHRALMSYQVANQGLLHPNIPQTLEEICATGSLTEDEVTALGDPCEELVDLSFLVPKYIPRIPHDPTLNTQISLNPKALAQTANATGYLVGQNNNQLGLQAKNSESTRITAGLPCGVKAKDSRDGNIYNTVQIGDQCWMAENLKYLPEVSPSEIGSDTEPHYYVYGHQDTDVSAAKATTNYETYGVLYNWPAAMAGEESSDINPSGVQGVCPAGWHLPSDKEFKELEMQLGMTEEEANSSGFQGEGVGSALAKDDKWYNDELTLHERIGGSGFDALPAGCRYPPGDSFIVLRTHGNFWSSVGVNFSAPRMLISKISSSVALDEEDADFGFSVRCLFD